VTLSTLAGLTCGILPAWQLWRGGARENLSDAGERGSGGKSASLLRRSLVTAEVALACMLLIAAGLLIRSFAAVLNVDLGFQSKSATAWRADPVREFKSLAEGNRYYDQLVEKVSAIPGVESVGLTDCLPLGRNRTWGAGAKGVSYPPGTFPIAFPRMVDHRYLQTMRIPLRSGRYFDERDTTDTPKVIVINETMARGLWPGQEAVGEVVTVGRSEWRVIGVVGDVRHSTLEESPGAEMYLNFLKCPIGTRLKSWFALHGLSSPSCQTCALLSELMTRRSPTPNSPPWNKSSITPLLRAA
jgi:hypothetical protein